MYITQLIEELQDICGSIGDIPVYIVDKSGGQRLRDWKFLSINVDSIGDRDENDICIIYPDDK